MNWLEPAGLEEALDVLRTNRSVFIYKHSNRCGVSNFALKRLSAVEPASGEVWMWIDVVNSRPLSLALGQELSVRHESPQLILISKGQVLAHTSHSGVTEDTVEQWRANYITA